MNFKVNENDPKGRLVHLVACNLRPGVGGDAAELLTEAVVERREICESGS